MPYNKRYNCNRRRYRRRSYKKPSSSDSGYLGMASRALSVAMAVKKLVNVEYKSYAVAVGDTSPDTTPVIQNLTAIATGDDYNDREGRKLRSVSLRLKGNMSFNASATNSAIRMMIVRDNMGSTTAPVITDIFEDATAFNDNKQRLDDSQTSARFTVLHDGYYPLNSNVPRRQFDIYKKLDHHVTFTGVTSTSEGKGSLWLITSSQEAINLPSLKASSVFKWIDN